MAKIKFLHAADMRGKIGGSVFSRNKGGSYVRVKVTPLNPQTTAQVEARSLLTSLSQNFRSLTQAQITAWNAATDQWATTDIFSDLVTPTGLSLYVRLNANISNAGGSLLTVPPSPVGADAITALSVAADVSSSSVDITFAPSTVPTGHTMYIESTPMLSPGINNANSRFRFIATAAAAATSPASVYAEQTAKFGALVAGQKLYVRAKFINKNTGEVSQMLKANCIVTA